MKVVVTMEFQDDEGNLISKSSGQVNNIRAMSSITVISLVRQWFSETYCKLYAESAWKGKP